MRIVILFTMLSLFNTFIFKREILAKAYHHPTDIVVKKKFDLPLKNGKFLTCETCHTQHLKKNSDNPCLRKDSRSLCKTCHQDKFSKSNNHPIGGHTNIRCSSCHKMHFGNKDLLIKKKQSDLCSNCHKDKKVKHSNISTIVGAFNLSKINLDNNNINCLTCHSMHNSFVPKSILVNKPDVLKFCANCHEKNPNKLFCDFHNYYK